MTSLLQKVLGKYLARGNVKIRDVSNVDKILHSLISKGPNNLQIITDFDQTVTRYHYNGQTCDSCYGVFNRSPLLSEEFKANAKALFEKYYPLEISIELSVEEKIPMMICWYNDSLKDMIDAKVNKLLVKSAIKEGRAILRENARLTFEELNKANVPVLIFSAGIADIIEEILIEQDAFFPNMTIVANKMVFDDEGYLTKFQDPIIHTFNKNESVLGGNKLYFTELSHRTNAILLGDHLGDIHMANGMPEGTILKIGFLDVNIDGHLNEYMENYDIVIIDDQSWDLFKDIVQNILQNLTP